MTHSRELLKGTLTTILLKLLADNGQMYGYEITQKVKELSNDKILLKEGSLYPALHKLQADGLVLMEEVHIGKRVRIYYKLTEPGEERTALQINELLSFLSTIEQLITAQPSLQYAHTL
jgi:PadR family transcriptional regulator PadR